MFALTRLFTISIAALIISVSAAPIKVARSDNSGQGTYFTPGLGSCGITNADSDYIVAVSTTIFDNYPGATSNPNDNPICGEKILVTCEHDPLLISARSLSVNQFTDSSSGSPDGDTKTVTVTVTDRCEACSEYDLDFSPTAFQQLADEALGRIDITWQYVDGTNDLSSSASSSIQTAVVTSTTESAMPTGTSKTTASSDSSAESAPSGGPESILSGFHKNFKDGPPSMPSQSA
ncbi:hypothetical protein EW146_g5478 [Bondarzewia mesenterica]|uniref:RlpA-like protein double-psi beta-barrel domain-containing protein n=1 Tax=Bondarzewia mesenterica TaxID=1095465 RepID=A0A4S4LRB8_9AGAM|nr:hypothetical protein EW146_g5478 [Bondarzewia mesenterica]